MVPRLLRRPGPRAPETSWPEDAGLFGEAWVAPSWGVVDVDGGAKRDGEFQARLDSGLSGAPRHGGNLMRASTLVPCLISGRRGLRRRADPPRIGIPHTGGGVGAAPAL